MTQVQRLKKTILVVDDDPNVLTLVSGLIVDSEYNILTASTSAKALQQSR